MFTRTAFISLLLLASAGAQTINPNQIRPGTNGYVLTTIGGVTVWGTGAFTLGATSIALGGTTTAVTGLTVNGVTLNGAGSSALFLNQAGTYTTPGTGTTAFNTITSGTNTTAAMVCGAGCSLIPGSTGTILANAVNLAALGNGGIVGNLPVMNLNGGTAAGPNTFWSGDGTWKVPGPGAVVNSINANTGAFIFSGTGVSCTGTTCVFSSGGSGSVSGGIAGHVPLFGSPTAITANSHLDEVTNAGSDTFTQPVIVNDGTGKAGNFGLAAGTAPSAAPANTIQINAPATVTAYGINLPGAQPTAGNTRLDCTAANPSICSWTTSGACPTCVTSAAALTLNQLVIGGGLQASSTLGSLGTTTTVLHGNASGAPSFGAVSLTADVTGVLPAANVAASLTSTTSVNSTTIPASSTLPVTIASGATALGTSSISTASCATVVTATATGTASTDAIIWNPNGSIKAVTGYVPATTGGLTIAAYPTANAVNFDVCNWTSGSITPGAVTINWRVVR